MKQFQSYFYIGPKEIAAKVDPQYEGCKISQIEDIQKWVKASNQTIVNDVVIATFIINEAAILVLSDRHSEHVACAGGRNVLSAGEITFNFEEGEVYISEITNQSTGYCPKPSSWTVVDLVLNKLKIAHPKYFTSAFEFRYCEHCQTKNLIKEEIYECAVCDADLDLEWNMNKMCLYL